MGSHAPLRPRSRPALVQHRHAAGGLLATAAGVLILVGTAAIVYAIRRLLVLAEEEAHLPAAEEGWKVPPRTPAPFAPPF